ncbi:glycosyltransferase family 2 protein [Desulfobaculum sp.]
MSAPPVVSILLPVRNGDAWLGASLESVLAQTLTRWECLVVDDASTDATPDILAQCADSRIRVLRNSRPRGVAWSLNRALAAARAPLLARQDADDESLPTRLERQVEFLRQYPSIGVVGTGVHMVDEAGRPAGAYRLHEYHARISWALCFGHPFAHPTVCMRRRVIEQVGGYDVTFPAAQDHDLWTRLAGRTRFANIPDQLVIYRRHAGAVSAARQRQLAADARARARHLSWLIGRAVGEGELFWNPLPHPVPGEEGLSRAEVAHGVAAYGALVCEARRAFLRRMHLGEAEQRAVSALAGRRLWSVAARLWRVSPVRALPLMARAAALCPQRAMRSVGERLTWGRGV